jgi:protein-tyrosine-phosphatase
MAHILFLCTGNTCRSPMAKCLMEDMTKRLALPITCDSAGLIAFPGAPASPGAQRAMASRGLSLRGHRAKRISAALAKKADVVLCMTEAHRNEFIHRFPEYAGKAHVFIRPVPDPFGGSDSLYVQTADQLAYLLEEWLQEH